VSAALRASLAAASFLPAVDAAIFAVMSSMPVSVGELGLAGLFLLARFAG
jgi:hypothetical protein